MDKDPQKPKSQQKCKTMSSLFCRRNNTVLVHQIGRDMSTELLNHPCYQFTRVIFSIIIYTWANFSLKPQHMSGKCDLDYKFCAPSLRNFKTDKNSNTDQANWCYRKTQEPVKGLVASSLSSLFMKFQI